MCSWDRTKRCEELKGQVSERDREREMRKDATRAEKIRSAKDYTEEGCENRKDSKLARKEAEENE